MTPQCIQWTIRSLLYVALWAIPLVRKGLNDVKEGFGVSNTVLSAYPWSRNILKLVQRCSFCVNKNVGYMYKYCWVVYLRFPTMWYLRPARLRPLIRAFSSCLNTLSLRLLTEHHLEFLGLKGGCTGLSESTLVKIPHCWKSHVKAHFFFEPSLDVENKIFPASTGLIILGIYCGPTLTWTSLHTSTTITGVQCLIVKSERMRVHQSL